MITNIFLFLFFTLSCNYASSQTSTPGIYLNHIFIVLDSVAYSKLTDSNFITQKLGNLKAAAAITTGDAWSGKYLHGKNGYFEFFSTKSYKVAVPGDCGFGFMTKKANDILTVETNWKAKTRDSIIRDTSMRLLQGVKKPWFYSLSLYTEDSLQPLSAWLMENTPEELTSVGFSIGDVKKEISWEDYMKKKNKKNFEKSFDRILSVHLLLNKKNYKYLRTSLLGFGLREKEGRFFNDQIIITYELTEHFTARVQTVETELTGHFEEIYIILSNSLKVHVHENKATWIFTTTAPVTK